MTTLDILLNGATEGDAITQQALRHQSWLHEVGVASRLYAEHVDRSIADQIRPISLYRPSRGATHVIYHHSTGSAMVETLCQRAQQLALVYHNVTPGRFFHHVDPMWAHASDWGRSQLTQLRPKTAFAFADSQYNADELTAQQFPTPTVLPLTFAPTLHTTPENAQLATEINRHPLALLFVGRFSPNKKQADLIKLLHAVRKHTPDVHLYLVGDCWRIGYDRWVAQLATTLGLQKNVTITGKVSQQDLVTYFRHCDFYVSMSEHEGFGRPYLESMVFGLPIVAFAEGGTRDTLATVGIQFSEKRYGELAGVFGRIQSDPAFRQRLIDAQTGRLQHFTERRVRAIFLDTLKQHGLLNNK